MKSLKTCLFVSFWIATSFLWTGTAHTATPVAPSCAVQTQAMETWLTPHPELMAWYKYYQDQEGDCEKQNAGFLRMLANSMALSTKLNQMRISVDEFYIPLANLLNADWKQGEAMAADIQSNLTILNQSLERVLSNMSQRDRQSFRGLVFLDAPSEFV